jgi:hypothetical protein
MRNLKQIILFACFLSSVLFVASCGSINRGMSDCLTANSKAQSDLKASYKQSKKEMAEAEKAKLFELKAARKDCKPTVISQTIGETVTLPHAGDVVVPATGDDGSFSIPGEKGLFKVEEHKCFIDAQGRKICK